MAVWAMAVDTRDPEARQGKVCPLAPENREATSQLAGQCILHDLGVGAKGGEGQVCTQAPAMGSGD